MSTTATASQFDLEGIQAAIRKFGFDGWLLYDFRGSNQLAQRVLEIPEDAGYSRRYYYYIPAEGEPTQLVHRIETEVLEHLPGSKSVYLRWQELHEHLAAMVGGSGTIAMEYSPMNANPYVARVDAGTVELVRSFGAEIASSGNLIQYFEARWSDEQWALHQQADRLNQAAFELAWKFVADNVRARNGIRETDVQQMVMDYYHENGMTTYHAPIVGIGPNSGNPHYSPEKGSDRLVEKGEFLLLDMWAKMDVPGGVYSDLTKVGFIGESVPEEYTKIFNIVAAARDAGIACAKEALEGGRELQGWVVDQATRDVIDEAGYGEYFIHRTGHNIGQETHGNGAHIDNLETKEERLLMPRTCFSIEPGIYLDAFGVRSEINVYIHADNRVEVTGGIQTEVLPILAEY